MKNSDIHESTIIDLLAKLEEILVMESNALSGALSERPAELAAEKELVLSRLEEITVTLQDMALVDQRVVDKLRQCQRINDENNVLVNQRLKIIRDANQIVRNQTGVKSVELYDGGGKLVQSTNRKMLSEV